MRANAFVPAVATYLVVNSIGIAVALKPGEMSVKRRVLIASGVGIAAIAAALYVQASILR